MDYLKINVEYPSRFSRQEVEDAIIGQLDIETFNKIGIRFYRDW